MISFEVEGRRFQFRAVGVAVHDGRVLLHQAEGDDFWALPGGRVELLESAAAALVREIAEELHVEAEVERLLWVAENFFRYEGQLFHELGFYFLMALPEAWIEAHFDDSVVGLEDSGVRLTFRWFDLDALHALPLYPTFLAHGLQALPAGVQHLVHADP